MQTSDTNPATGSEDDPLRPFRAGFYFSFFNAMGWMIALGTPLVLLAEKLGATSDQIGLLYSFVFLLLPIQVLATITLPRFGFKRQVLFAWWIRTFFLLIPLGIAVAGPEGHSPQMVALLMAAMFCFCFFRSIGTCGVQPWLFDLLTERHQSRYFGTDAMVVGVAGILTLVISGLTFSFLDTGYTAFSIQFGLAFVGSVCAMVALGRLPEVPPPEPFGATRVFTEGPRIVREGGPFRQYMLLTIIWHVTGCALVPFGAYFLRVEMELSRDLIIWFTAMTSAGGIVGAALMRRRLEVIGVRNAFTLSAVLNSLIFLLWAGFVAGRLWLGWSAGEWILVMGMVYFLLGVSGSCFMLAHLRYLAFLASGRDRALRVSLQTAVIGFLTGLAVTGWGWVFRKSGGEPGMNVMLFFAYFLFAFAVQASMIRQFRKLQEPVGDFIPLFNPRGVVRTFRYLATMPMIRYGKK